MQSLHFHHPWWSAREKSPHGWVYGVSQASTQNSFIGSWEIATQQTRQDFNRQFIKLTGQQRYIIIAELMG